MPILFSEQSPCGCGLAVEWAEASGKVDVIIEVPSVTAERAVMGMRRAFLRVFGKGPFGRRIGSAAWTAFSAALVHGAGMDAALAMARTAAGQCNARMMLVARWSERRIAATVAVAGACAAATC